MITKRSYLLILVLIQYSLYLFEIKNRVNGITPTPVYKWNYGYILKIENVPDLLFVYLLSEFYGLKKLTRLMWRTSALGVR